MTTCPQARPALFKRGSLSLVLVFIMGMLTINAAHAQMVTDTFHFTGAAQTWTVPPNVTSILVEAIGGDGGGSATGYLGSPGISSSPGGYVKADVAVSGGQVLNIYVGGAGNDITAGWNGGGVVPASRDYGAGGGGASDIRVGGTTLYDRILVAGAGGGGTYGTTPYVGGSGGGLVGGNGGTNDSNFTPGKGGTQSAGGAAGSGYGVVAAGSFGVGGGSGTYHTAGGGGGWYGGGSGSGTASAGGGSSYTDSTLCSNVVHRQGDTNSIADGAIYITYCDASIYQQPLDTITCDGGSAYFAVTTSGSDLAFQWQMNTGSGWNDIVGGRSRSLSFNATSAMNGAGVRMRMLSPCNADTIYSNVATLTVTPPQVASVRNDTICLGDTAKLITNASRAAYITWYDSLIGGSNIGSGDTLRIAGATNSTTYYAQAQYLFSNDSDSVSTPYNGQQWMSGAMFDVVPTKDMIITGFDANILYREDYQVYYKVGTHVGFESNASAWTLLGTVRSLAPVGPNLPTPMGINISVPLQANTRYAFYITDIYGGMVYCSVGGTIGNYWAGNSDITVYQGVGKDFPFGTNIGVRSINATIHYDLLDTPCVSSRTPVSLTINDTLSIISNPVNSTVCLGNSTYYKVGVTGMRLTYQWQVNAGSGWSNISNGGIYSGANTDSLILTTPTASEDGNLYRCLVNNACGYGDTSNSATLTIHATPTILIQPSHSTTCLGEDAYYKVVASGGGLTYQWQVNTGSGWNNVTTGGIYTGATTDSLTVIGVTAAHNGYRFRCIISNSCSTSVTSRNIGLSIDVPPSIWIDTQNSTAICLGSNIQLGVSASGASITYQWQVDDGTGWNNITNGGVYSGATGPTLNITAPPLSYDSYQYRCVVSGACTPNDTSTICTVTIYDLPRVVDQPSNSTICSGGNTYFKINDGGTGTGYRWQVNTGSGWTNLSNGGVYSRVTTDSLVLTDATTAQHGYQYRCVVNGCSPSAVSNAATLTIDVAPSVTGQPTNSTICENTNTSFSVVATGTNLTYQWQVNTGSGWTNISNGGIYSGATTNTLSLTATTTSNNGYQYRCVVSGTCSPSATSVAATLTVNSLPSISVSPIGKTICDGDNTSYTVTASGTGITYQWQVNAGTGWTNLSNTGIYSGATTSLLTLTGATTTYNGNQYRVVVSGTCTPPATSGAANLTVHPIVTPTVGITASATTICATTSVTFTVSSSSNGGSNPSYQWKVNGNNVGSNSTTYTTTSLSNGDIVTCVMTTNAPCPTSTTATSNGITMTVNPLLTPTISISSATGDSVCDTRTATFTASITHGGNAPVYQWKVNGNNVGTNNNSYATNSLTDGDVISCELTSNALCASPKVVNSNTIRMRVIPLSFASANISVTPDTEICEGDQVVAYCYYTNGGINPKFEWYINGTLQPNSSSGSYTSNNFNDNDAIYCVYTNGNVCPEPVTTNTEVMNVHQTVSPSVSIIASSGNVIAPGWTVTFTAQPMNGGANPTYAWRKNGQFVVGETGVTYTASDLEYGDQIDVVMKGDWQCKDREYSMSNVMIVNIPANVANQQGKAQELELYPNPNKGVFNLKGAIGSVTGEASVYILNSLGQKVYETVVEVREGRIDEQLNMPQSLSAGMYMLSIEVKGSRVQKRFSIIE